MRSHISLTNVKPSTRRQVILRRRYALIFVAILAALVILSLSMTLQAYASNTEEITWIEVQVKKGDTLWGLVNKHYTGREDIRKVIYEVREINNLESSAITPRQWVKIPIK